MIYYSTQIFKTADLSEENAQIATIGVGLVNVITTIFSVFLVEMVGRKPLLIIGFAGMTVDLTLLLICLYYVVSILCCRRIRFNLIKYIAVGNQGRVKSIPLSFHTQWYERMHFSKITAAFSVSCRKQIQLWHTQQSCWSTCS